MMLETAPEASFRIAVVGLGACGIDVVRALAQGRSLPRAELCSVAAEPLVLERATGTRRFLSVETPAVETGGKARCMPSCQPKVPGLPALAELLSTCNLAVLVADLTDPSWMGPAPGPGSPSEDQTASLEHLFQLLLPSVSQSMPELVLGVGLVDEDHRPWQPTQMFVQLCEMSFLKKGWSTTGPMQGHEKQRLDDVLELVWTLVEPLIEPGPICLDFADIKTITHSAGLARFATASASGKDRAKLAAQELVHRGNACSVPLSKARFLYFTIRGGNDMTLHEVNDVAIVLQDAIDGEANILFSSSTVDGQSELTATLVWG